MNFKRFLFLGMVFSLSASVFSQQHSSDKKQTSGNPVFPGWYADPEGAVFGNEYWIYPTYSAPYDQQTFMDAFSSRDLVHWKKHPRVLSIENISWVKRALWAPAIIEANKKYYFFFGGNDIQNNNQLGGIGVAVADNPAGPFKDALGKPLIGQIVNGAQPIDQFVFKDDDGQYYMKWNIFPKEIVQTEIPYYLRKQNKYGLPLDNRETYTKTDWIIWTATLAPDRATFEKFIDPIHLFMNETTTRVPMSDWIFTDTPNQKGFQARSVVGGYFIKMLENKLNK